MPNWCSTAYVIDGDAKEVKQLYELMKGLEERKTPSVENGFGTTWLGCLVDALGKDWNDVRCRGSWNGLEMDGDVLKFSTETAWAPCSETFDLVREAFPNLRYYFQAEEPGMEVYDLSSDCSLQLDYMKLESLVIADQNATVNTFPGLVHTARHTMGVGNARSQ